MQVVYLDQNAACFVAKSNPEPIWQEIREALADGFRERKLICPLPFEGVVETAPRPLQLRQSIQALFWELSEGVAFKAFTEMSNELPLALIRPLRDWSPWSVWKPIWAEMGYAAYAVKSGLRSEKERMTKRVKSFVKSRHLEGMSERELFHAVAAQRSGWICSDLNCLFASRATETSLNCPWLIEFLVSENISPAEVEALKRAVQYHGWAKIPIHALEILLGAKWEYDSIRGGAAPYKPNDEIDRKRAAVALKHADLFITEGDLANLCQKVKVSSFSPTLVLSVRNPEKILETVRSITRDRNALNRDSAAHTGLG